MSNDAIKFKYKPSYIPKGYSFSVKNNIILLPEYFESIENERVRVAMQYVAMRARHHYVSEVNELKAAGKKVNTYFAKHDAGSKAEEEAKIKFSDVWDEVEKVYATYENLKASPRSPITTRGGLEYITFARTGEGKRFIVAVIDSDTLAQCTPHDGIQFIAEIKQLMEENP